MGWKTALALETGIELGLLRLVGRQMCPWEGLEEERKHSMQELM